MIDVRRDVPLRTEDVIRVFDDSGLIRPTDDPDRITRMFAASNLVVSAWDGGVLVGVARALTDFSYCCYLSDLAVAKSHQRQGVGKRLVDEVRHAIGEGSTLILIAAPGAIAYYPKLGFAKSERAYVLQRTR
ncbi:MAG: GNAT family N-acetyltransferase [Lysobacterales bacterium]